MVVGLELNVVREVVTQAEHDDQVIGLEREDLIELEQVLYRRIARYAEVQNIKPGVERSEYFREPLAIRRAHSPGETIAEKCDPESTVTFFDYFAIPHAKRVDLDLVAEFDPAEPPAAVGQVRPTEHGIKPVEDILVAQTQHVRAPDPQNSPRFRPRRSAWKQLRAPNFDICASWDRRRPYAPLIAERAPS